MRCKFLFSLIIIFSCFSVFAQSPSTVSKVIRGVPDDLSSETLLVPRYDFLDPENMPDGAPPRIAVNFNREAKKANTTIHGIATKSYSGKFKLAGLGDIEQLKEKGYKYFMDMVLMPKQMSEPEIRAMKPSYVKYGAAHKMFRNQYTQFHYYFYIRDLQTNEAYITSRFKGSWDVYKGMKTFFKQLSKDME